jgi:hypothetical protein
MHTDWQLRIVCLQDTLTPIDLAFEQRRCARNAGRERWHTGRDQPAKHTISLLDELCLPEDSHGLSACGTQASVLRISSSPLVNAMQIFRYSGFRQMGRPTNTRLLICAMQFVTVLRAGTGDQSVGTCKREPYLRTHMSAPSVTGM